MFVTHVRLTRWIVLLSRFLCLHLLLGAALAMAQSNPVPFLYQPTVPVSIAPGGPGITLTVNGTGFSSTSGERVAEWNADDFLQCRRQPPKCAADWYGAGFFIFCFLIHGHDIAGPDSNLHYCGQRYRWFQPDRRLELQRSARRVHVFAIFKLSSAQRFVPRAGHRNRDNCGQLSPSTRSARRPYDNLLLGLRFSRPVATSPL